MRSLTIFRHPHLIHGVVHTKIGTFPVVRGYVRVPDELGRSLGWTPADEDSGDANTRGPEASTRAVRAERRSQ